MCSTVAVESSPSKASKKSSDAKDAKRKRDAETDATAVAAPKKGKSTSLDAGDAQGENAKAVKVPPPVLPCTSLMRACSFKHYSDRHSQTTTLVVMYIMCP